MQLIPIGAFKVSDEIQNKVKWNRSLPASWRRNVGDVTPLFLNSALDRDLLLASCPDRFIPSGKVPGTPEMHGYVENGTGLYYVDEREISSPYRERNQDPSEVQPVVWSQYCLSYLSSKGDGV
jgi:hypothetical protein